MQKSSEAARKARAAYMREYRKRNPEKTREINERYWERRATRELKQGEKENAS